MNDLTTTATPSSNSQPAPRSCPAPGITPHLGLVSGIAGKLARRGRLDLCNLDLDDLVAIGTEALIHAAHRFDPTRGATFTTFAFRRVEGAMLDALRSNGCYGRRRGEARTDPGQQILVLSLEAHEGLCLSIADDSEAPDDAAHNRATTRRLRGAVNRLPATERRLIEGYFFEDRNLDQLGAEIGLSRSWTCRLLQRSLGHVREMLADA